MKTNNFLASAALLAIAVKAQEPLIDPSQWGNFAVINYCSFDIYLWSVEGGAEPGPMVTLPGGKPWIGYKEQYRQTPNFGGVSLKASPNYGPGNSVPSDQLTQLEYTVPSQTDPSQAIVRSQLFYDVSWVNGNPFAGIPMTMQTSDPDHCSSGTCGAGNDCSIGYEWSTDDSKTHSCGLAKDIIFSFCSSPGGSLASNVKLGPLKRDVEEREAQEQVAPIGYTGPVEVCVVAGPNGQPEVEECEFGPAAASPTSSASAIAALQQSATSTTVPVPTTTAAAPPPPAPTPTTTTTPPAPTPTTAAAPPPPAQTATSNSGVVSFAALTNLADTPVTEWLSFNGQQISKREILEHHAHRHNHQAFHRRNRIIKA